MVKIRPHSISILGGLLFAANAVMAQLPPPLPEPALRSFSSYVDDVNGDGVPDIAVAEPFHPDGGQVTLVCGSSDAMLHQFNVPHGEQNFGMAIFPSCDLDGDGIGDIAIGSLVPSTSEDEDHRGVIRVYSTASGKELAYILEIHGAGIVLADLRHVGDLNDDKTIDGADIALWSSSVLGGSPITEAMHLDLNRDGLMDGADLVELVARIGAVGDAGCEQALIDWLNTGGLITEDPTWEGTGIGEEYQPVQMGFLGCAWCLIKCGKSIKEAADCGNQYQDHIKNVCGPLADQGKYFEYSECLDDARLNFLPKCLQDVAGGAGDCAKCVAKCGPKPSV